jgi:hypothetical protein
MVDDQANEKINISAKNERKDGYSKEKRREYMRMYMPCYRLGMCRGKKPTFKEREENPEQRRVFK